MPPVHFRNGKNTIVLAEAPTVKVPSLIAGLAEVLIGSQLATQEQIAGLRLAIQRDEAWQDISHSEESLESLGITESTIVAYTFSAETPFGYEPYES